MTLSSLNASVMTTHPAQEAAVAPDRKTSASPAKALQEIVTRQISGRLTIGDPNDRSIFWRVYVGNGQVHFATSAIGQQERLSYLLRRHYLELTALPLVQGQSDYQFVCNLWQSSQISLQEVRQLIFSLTQEALTQLLSLPQASLQFERTVGLDPLLLSVSLKQTILPVRRTIKEWAQLRPDITSPFERPCIKDLEQFSQWLWQNTVNPQRIQLLSDLMKENLCLYEIAAQLDMEVLELTQLLHPLVEIGAVVIRPYCTAQSEIRPLVACIDDSKTVQRNVRLTLEASGFKVLELTEPLKALSVLARQKPALILMDITMPELDGYELCRMLRQSTLLRDIPIVMLTGREGLIDRLRARMVGATDYITKPFAPQELLSIVQKSIATCQLEN